MSKQKVFVTRMIPDSGLKLLKKHFSVKVARQDSPISKKELIKGVKWADALLCLLNDKIDDSILKLNPNLKVVANYAVGYNNIDTKAATKRKIPVTNTPGVLTDAVAEHTFALMLAITKRIPESDVFTRKGKYKGWAPMLFLGMQLKDKTLGIIGAGRIGVAVALRAKALGMNIIYTNPKRNPLIEKKTKAKKTSLSSLLKKADVTSIHVPLLPSTKHLISKKQLTLMKKSAYLINTSRGPVIDEKALVSALKKKQIAGAALDVYEWEPKLTKGLTSLSNVILTPHIASGTIETRQAMSLIAAKNIFAILKGKKGPQTVNPEVYK